MKPGSRIWLLSRRLRFLLTPAKRRISLKIDTDGRHLTFLLASLHEARAAIRVLDSPWLFRELLSLSVVAPLPFIIDRGGSTTDGLVITDDPSFLENSAPGRRILLDPDIFGEAKRDLPKMPYFIHPHALHRGIPCERSSSSPRPVRLGFFGSHDPGFYEVDFNFPILSRTPIIETLLNSFRDQIHHVQGPPSGWGSLSIALAIDSRGGDRGDKTFLAQGDYFAGLHACDFFLSPPGWCMPVSHNLIEAMQCGAIPILNHPHSLDPALRHGVNCLVFDTLDDLKTQIRAALEMPSEQIKRMREAVIDHYSRHLRPGAWWKRCLIERPPVVLVNNEEVSVAIRDNA